MNRDEARKRWHRRLDEGRDDAELDKHLEACEPSRRYDLEMNHIVGALNELRRDTESVVSRAAPTTPSTVRPIVQDRGRAWLRPVTGIAASVAMVVGVSLYFTIGRRPEAPLVGLDNLVDVSGEHRSPVRDVPKPQLGLSLRGDCAKRFLAVAKPTTQANVQVFWLYPTLVSHSEDDSS